MSLSQPAQTHVTSRHWHASSAVLAEVDLQALIAAGYVTSVTVQDDGGLQLQCPQGLPAEISHHFQPLDEPLEERIARLEGGLAQLSSSLLARERLTDRLDAVEFGLTERLQGMIAEELLDLASDDSAPTEGLLTLVRDQGAAVLSRIDAAEAQFSPVAAELARLTERIAALEAKPAPQVDLTAQRQGFASFATALGTALRRVEAAADRLGDFPEPVDLSGLQALMAEVAARPQTDLAPLVAAVEGLGARLQALEDRPAPVLDLTAQRQGLASFAVAMNTALQRMEALVQSPQEGPDLAPITARLDDLSAAFARMPATVEAALAARLDGLGATSAALEGLTAAVEALGVRLQALEARPADLGEQRRSFANFATALGSMLRRVENLTDAWPSADRFAALEARLDAALAPRTDTLAEAILTLAQRAAAPGTDVSAFEAAQKEFFQDLRFLLAEIVASQMQRSVAAR